MSSVLKNSGSEINFLMQAPSGDILITYGHQIALAGRQEFFQSSRRNLVFADLFQQVTFHMLIASVLEVGPKINKCPLIHIRS